MKNNILISAFMVAMMAASVVNAKDVKVDFDGRSSKVTITDSLKNIAVSDGDIYVPIIPLDESLSEKLSKSDIRNVRAGQNSELFSALTAGTIKRSGGYPGRICTARKFIQAGEELKAYIGCMSSDFDQTVPVRFEGSALKFKYTYYSCANMPSNKWYPCPWEISIEAKMATSSPFLLKTKETAVRQFNIAYSEFYEGEWQISKE